MFTRYKLGKWNELGYQGEVQLRHTVSAGSQAGVSIVIPSFQTPFIHASHATKDLRGVISLVRVELYSTLRRENRDRNNLNDAFDVTKWSGNSDSWNSSYWECYGLESTKSVFKKKSLSVTPGLEAYLSIPGAQGKKVYFSPFRWVRVGMPLQGESPGRWFTSGKGCTGPQPRDHRTRCQLWSEVR